ncbi:TIR domain-containing protein [Pectobacterium aroidearum]|uniref:toll/interleukin-1 receptor domain-containing protein n=1 Tax=Pectobacterium aroidearum TaxID=1201031 RepID=UPI0021140D0C|nr:TIR domain-containing protein [Pectobacterium aroidearum]UUE37826.1 TIR domain-containing protein [Pectobacterium aroidearum]UUE42201.1 TIR domain-containing protein [Pectobacterium aroidearum]
MSISTITSSISRIRKEIVDLHHRISLETKKESDCGSRIGQINRSVNKNTSESTLKSKAAEIERKHNEIANIQVKKSVLHKRLSDKENQLLKLKQDLIKEEDKEQKKQAAIEERERKRLADLEKKQQREQLYHQRQLQAEIRRTKEMASEVQNNLGVLNDLPNIEYDLFISHASEDKEEFVRPLAETLERMGVKVWYDEFTLKVGDSLRKSIDHGLVKSKFGTVILSTAFCSKNWTQYELDSMVAREMNGYKMILPIWHKISKDEVIKFSPALADKVALNTSISSIQEIAGELSEVIKGIKI